MSDEQSLRLTHEGTDCPVPLVKSDFWLGTYLLIPRLGQTLRHPGEYCFYGKGEVSEERESILLSLLGKMTLFPSAQFPLSKEAVCLPPQSSERGWRLLGSIT